MRHGFRVHQFVPTLAPRDAVGSHTLATHRALQRARVAGGIWGDAIFPEVARFAKHYTSYPRSRAARRRRNVLLYQASVGARRMTELLLERPEPLTLTYHNVTPAEFFEPYDAPAALVLGEAREELKRLSARVDVAIACSGYNARELVELGFEDVRVAPPYYSLQGWPAAGRPADQGQKAKRGLDVLFVGRVAPNKGHRHLLRSFAVLRDAIDPDARLSIVGAWGPEPYMRELFRLRDRLGAKGVVFTGPVSDEALVSHYEAADALLCLSEHEGFGVPLVEAMKMGVSVVAYDAGAVGETLGGAGVLVRTLDPVVVAELVARIGNDAGLRQQLILRQYERVRELEAVNRDDILFDVVSHTART